MRVEISTVPVAGSLLYPDNILRDPLTDYEYGGIALNDSTKGLRYQVWMLKLKGEDFILSSPSTTDRTLISVPNVSDICLSFDQNMNPFVGYTNGDSTSIWWFDPRTSQQVTSFISTGITSIACALDDKRVSQTGNSDIQFTYIRGGRLYVRTQRDRYAVEYDIGSAPPGRIRRFGLSSKYRLQWDIG